MGKQQELEDVLCCNSAETPTNRRGLRRVESKRKGEEFIIGQGVACKLESIPKAS